MSKIIGIDTVRKKLLKQQEEIRKKLETLDSLEQLPDGLRISVTDNISVDDNGNIVGLTTSNQDRFGGLTIVNACKKIFEDDSHGQYSIKDVMEILVKGGLELSEKYAYPTVSSTLNRIVDRGELAKLPYGNKMLFQKKSNGKIEITEPLLPMSDL